MEYVFAAMLSIGPIALVVGLVVAFCSVLLLLPGSNGQQMLARTSAVVVAAAVGYVVGAAGGMFGFCLMCSCGNLCGLGALFGTGPLAAGLCMTAKGLAFAKQFHSGL